MTEQVSMRYRQLVPVLVGLLLCLGGSLAGLAYYLLAEPKYMARVTVAPPSDSNNVQPVSGTLGVLAGLAGGGTSSLDAHSQFLFQLTSYETAARLLRDKTIVDGLVARKKLGLPYTADALHGYVVNILKFDKPRGGLLEKSPLSILAVKDRDPQFAAYVLAKTIAESDALVKTRRMTELANRRNKIVETLSSVTTAEYREALIRLLAQVERERLFGTVDRNYSFRIVDPLTQSANPVDPSLAFSIGIGFFLGFVLAALFVVGWFLRVTIGSPRDD